MVRDAFALAKEKSKDRGGAIIFIDEVRTSDFQELVLLCLCIDFHHNLLDLSLILHLDIHVAFDFPD